MQAITRVNAEQTSKRAMREPTYRTDGEGRRWSSFRATTLDRSRRGSGDGMRARGINGQHGKPWRWGRVTPNEHSVTSRLGRAGWRIGP